MKKLIGLEELAIFAACIVAFTTLDFAWWWFPALLLVPDVAMAGYLFGPRAGAVAYNIAHHRALALAVGVVGVLLAAPGLQLAGVVMFAHISMDRMLGYGLKTTRGFKHTHLGPI
ncbi:MAG: DUF4260 domain-containing protein [Myxococcota bacterium]